LGVYLRTANALLAPTAIATVGRLTQIVSALIFVSLQG